VGASHAARSQLERHSGRRDTPCPVVFEARFNARFHWVNRFARDLAVQPAGHDHLRKLDSALSIIFGYIIAGEFTNATSVAY
jgi:hypothetical protein